jgi:polyhydroxyalkanoate synthesis regulator phasin
MAIEDLDDNLELDPSVSRETPDAVIVDPPEGEAAVADATSSTAKDVTDEGLLGVVRDVVKDRTKPDAAASSADGAEAGLDADGKPLPKGQDDEAFSDVPFNKHPRFQALIAQRNSFREDAVRYNNVTSFIENNGLTSDEAANALTTFARAKIDPAGAFAELKPWLQDLLVRAGEVLPDDLRARVEKGEMSAETAQELSRERAKSSSHEARQGFEAQRRERQSATQLVNDLTTTAADWEKDRLAKDPNFAAKAPLLMREVAYLQTIEGKPKDVAGVREQLKKAYDAVNKSFTPAAPANTQAVRRPAIKPVMGGQVSGTVREKPKTTLDIVRANRRSG